jgi:FKBP-type peptidyl-prolyl cis-trans isomerase
MPKGVKIEDLRVGDGALAGRKTTVTLRYDRFLPRGGPVSEHDRTFDMSGRDVIAGLRYGLEAMRVGGLRRLDDQPPT